MSVAPPEVQPVRAVLRFHVAGVSLALPAETVDVIVPPSETVPIPLAPAHIPGFMAVQGDAVPLFDLARFFALDAPDEPRAGDRDPRVLVVRSSRYRVGLLCETVEGVASIEVSRIAGATACRPARLREHALGETVVGGAVTPLLDLESLLEAGRAR